jgi:hypothetical protein
MVVQDRGGVRLVEENSNSFGLFLVGATKVNDQI